HRRDRDAVRAVAVLPTTASLELMTEVVRDEVLNVLQQLRERDRAGARHHRFAGLLGGSGATEKGEQSEKGEQLLHGAATLGNMRAAQGFIGFPALVDSRAASRVQWSAAAPATQRRSSGASQSRKCSCGISIATAPASSSRPCSESWRCSKRRRAIGS